MNLTRREALVVGAGGIAVAMLPLSANAAAIDDVISAFTGGASMGEGDVTLTAPEIAENGNTVPISVEAPGASEILVLASGNPTPKVCTFKFGPASGSQMASTRIRLAKTQDVIAIAKMGDGSFVKTAATVKVTIGGCGG
ncbi:thiosulfate oxidation carrier protein SoxY [Acidimangrovimonas pyrenivorans]|uniref:Thiosulfate oxidation carrier protein SoxY n=1 Tax=Acidimangrovimonas pyrenivorans TaxID=2030798 RepID=A0ABV7AH82_9RHOB